MYLRFYRSLTSLLLMLALLGVFTMRSLAVGQQQQADSTSAAVQKDAVRTPVPPVQPSGPPATGLLTGNGQVYVNGNPAESGATVVSGSTVSTGGDSKAVVDLGPSGRLELQADTTVVVTALPNAMWVNMDTCGNITQTLPPGRAGQIIIFHREKVRISVTRGEATVRHGKNEHQYSERLLKGVDSKTFDDQEKKVYGEGKRFDDALIVTSAGDAVISIDCGEKHIAGWWGAGGLLGLLGLATRKSFDKNKLPPPPTPSAINPG